MATNHPTFYDSDLTRKPIVSELQSLWNYRDLIGLLVKRDLTVRYKRSTLGMWWTLLNPLLTTLILWVIFGQFFRFETPGVPYVVYLLSGILLISFFNQAVIAAGSAIINNSGVLTKLYVPAEVFSFSATGAAAINFLISLAPLLVIQMINGVKLSWTLALVPIPILCLLALATGVGLLVASAAVFFYDVLDLTGVALQLLSYLTPTFYPISIVPDWAIPIIHANPLFSYLEIFRGFMYLGEFAPSWNFIYMFASALFVLIIGIWVFSRSWRNLIAVL